MPSYHFHAYARVQTHHVSMLDRSQLLLGLDSIDCDKSSILKKKFNSFDFSSRFSHDFLHLPPTSTAAEACRWCPRQYQIRCALPIFLANRVFVSHHNFGKYWHGFKSHKRKRCDTKCKIKRHHSRDGDKYKNCVGHGDKWGKVKIHIADNRSTQSFSEMLTSKSLSRPPSRFYIFFSSHWLWRQKGRFSTNFTKTPAHNKCVHVNLARRVPALGYSHPWKAIRCKHCVSVCMPSEKTHKSSSLIVPATTRKWNKNENNRLASALLLSLHSTV